MPEIIKGSPCDSDSSSSNHLIFIRILALIKSMALAFVTTDDNVATLQNRLHSCNYLCCKIIFLIAINFFATDTIKDLVISNSPSPASL